MFFAFSMAALKSSEVIRGMFRVLAILPVALTKRSLRCSLSTTRSVIRARRFFVGGAPSFQGGLKPVYLTVFNGEVYFNGSGELWVTNGTSGWHKRTNERRAGSI